jgi:hypothetical protein
MEEIWKRFKDTTYLVSNLGNVYNEYTSKHLKPFANNNGYLNIDIFTASDRQRFSVHRMVAMTFLENLDNLPCVNHKDGIKTNNRIENLEWCTHSENSVHAIETGLSSIGESHSNAKLTEKDVLEIQRLFEEGKNDKEITKLFNVTSGVISAIRLGKTWKHVSGKVFKPLGANPVKKLSAENIPVIREMILDGKSDAEIGRVYGVARGTINQIRQGKTWINY